MPAAHIRPFLYHVWQSQTFHAPLALFHVGIADISFFCFAAREISCLASRRSFCFAAREISCLARRRFSVTYLDMLPRASLAKRDLSSCGCAKTIGKKNEMAVCPVLYCSTT